MSEELLEIEPRELKFIVEFKKQSTCAVRLSNKCNHYVAFKVKTTSPKKFCVRPNIGVIEPKSSYNFKVIMQAPQVSPPDMISKDKFLVQSTVVTAETTDDDITSSMFAKDNNKHVEEHKMRVVLISPPNSPALSPMNGGHDHFPAHDTSSLKDQGLHRNEDIKPQFKMTQEIVEPKLEDAKPIAVSKAFNHEPVKAMEELKLVRDYNNLKSQISQLETKLQKAQDTISMLTEERRSTTQDSENLRQELALLRSKKAVRRVQVGYPFLFVCMVALIGVFLGYLLRF